MNETEMPPRREKTEKTCACCGVKWMPSREDPAVDKITIAEEGSTPTFATLHKRCSEFVDGACKKVQAIYEARVKNLELNAGLPDAGKGEKTS